MLCCYCRLWLFGQTVKVRIVVKVGIIKVRIVSNWDAIGLNEDIKRTRSAVASGGEIGSVAFVRALDGNASKITSFKSRRSLAGDFTRQFQQTILTGDFKRRFHQAIVVGDLWQS